MQLINSSAFTSADYPQLLGKDEIHLWLFADGSLPIARARNSAPPRFDDTLRAVLASYLQCDPASLLFERGLHGKPALKDRSLQFNLSHSGDAMLLAISRDQALGVDLENPGKPRSALALAERFFHTDEARALASLPDSLQSLAFLSLWSCKEALLKAMGHGLNFGLNKLAFALSGDGLPSHLAMLDVAAGLPAEWQVVRISPATGWIGALAWRGPPLHVIAFASTFAQGGYTGASKSA